MKRTSLQSHSPRKRFRVVCLLFGHDFDPIDACSDTDEYCHRCGKKCNEYDRWFQWQWWLRWRLLPVKNMVRRMKGDKDTYSF